MHSDRKIRLLPSERHRNQTDMNPPLQKIRVLSWSDIATTKFSARLEFWAHYKELFPEGIGPAIAAFLNKADDIEATGIHGQADELYQLDCYDVLIAWGHGGDARRDWESAVDPAVRKGRLGLIPLHSIWNRKAWPNITELSGAVSNIGDVREGVRVHVKKCLDIHPILHGVENFEVEDEIYFEPIELAEDVTRLLIGLWENRTSPFAWTREVDQGRIFYLQPGHETTPCYHHPMIQRLLVNGVRWVARHETIT